MIYRHTPPGLKIVAADDKARRDAALARATGAVDNAVALLRMAPAVLAAWCLVAYGLGCATVWLVLR